MHASCVIASDVTISYLSVFIEFKPYTPFHKESQQWVLIKQYCLGKAIIIHIRNNIECYASSSTL